MNETPVTSGSDTPQPQKSANNRLPWIILIIVTLLLGGVITWLALQLQSTTTKLSSSESEIASTQSQNDSTTDTTEPANPDAPVADTDQEQIINTAIGWGTARESAKGAKLTVNITKKQLPFADVSIGTEEGTGYACTLKKSNNVWLVLFCGQSVPSQAVLDEWGIPASFAKSDY